MSEDESDEDLFLKMSEPCAIAERLECDFINFVPIQATANKI